MGGGEQDKAPLRFDRRAGGATRRAGFEVQVSGVATRRPRDLDRVIGGRVSAYESTIYRASGRLHQYASELSQSLSSGQPCFVHPLRFAISVQSL